MDGNKHGGDSEPREHCKDGCRATSANLDGPVADVDQKPDNPGASSVDWADRHESMEKAWQVGRICEGCVERLGAGHVVLHGTVGEQPDERHEELIFASETPVMDVSLNDGREQESSSALHFPIMMTTTGRVLDIVGIAREGEGLKAPRRPVPEMTRERNRGQSLEFTATPSPASCWTRCDSSRLRASTSCTR